MLQFIKKTTMILAVLFLYAAPADTTFLPLASIPRLHSKFEEKNVARYLSSSICGAINNAAKNSLKESFGTSFDCKCTSFTQYYEVRCTSKGEICCSDICGNIDYTFVFGETDSGNIYAETGDVCIAFTRGVGELIGKTVCISVSLDDMGCNVNIDGDKCNSCGVCSNVPGVPDDTPVTVMNCTNIPGGEAISSECSDFESDSDFGDYMLRCAASSHFLLIPTIVTVFGIFASLAI